MRREATFRVRFPECLDTLALFGLAVLLAVGPAACTSPCAEGSRWEPQLQACGYCCHAGEGCTRPDDPGCYFSDTPRCEAGCPSGWTCAETVAGPPGFCVPVQPDGGE